MTRRGLPFGRGDGMVDIRTDPSPVGNDLLI